MKAPASFPFDTIFSSPVFHDILSRKAVAVAVSGGPDSMALAHMLSQAAQGKVHALTVDHGLRLESAQEAQQVGEWLKGWPRISHTVLRWAGDKPQTKLQEEARHARYDLMAAYCAEHAISHLFLAHHQDDQAETFLLRLAAGSGLDGLCAMREGQAFGAELTLMRPLLSIPKEALVEYCQAHHIPFVQDPSNQSPRFARVRLRQGREILEQEGLSAKRLSTTAQRLQRAQSAMEFYTDQLWGDCVKNTDTKQIVLKYEVLIKAPEEIVFRVLERVFEYFQPDDKSYGPRMERIETIAQDLLRAGAFRKRTLGGVVISRDSKTGDVLFAAEHAKT